MAKTIYKKGYLCISHPGQKTEAFKLAGNASFMAFNEKGVDRIAIEAGTDWVDFDDSELIGGSETLVSIWGLNASNKDLDRGLPDAITPKLKYKKPLGDGAFAWFFGSVGHRVGELSVELLGKRQIRIKMLIDDITEESDECITVLTLDTVVEKKPAKLECRF